MALIDIQLMQIKRKKLGATFLDLEQDHIEADKLLLKYIDDEMVTKAFNDIEKWYS